MKTGFMGTKQETDLAKNYKLEQKPLKLVLESDYNKLWSLKQFTISPYGPISVSIRSLARLKIVVL